MMTCRRWEQGFTLYTGSIPVWRTGIFWTMNWRHQWKVSLMGHNLIDWFELQTASKDTTELEGNSRKCERTKRSSSYCVTRRERNSSHMRKVKSRRCARLLLMQLKLESQKWHQNVWTRRLLMWVFTAGWTNIKTVCIIRVSGSIHSFISINLFRFEDRYSCPLDHNPNRRLCSASRQCAENASPRQLKTTCYMTSVVEASGNFSCFWTSVIVKPQQVIYYVTRSLHESSKVAWRCWIWACITPRPLPPL